MQTGFVPFAEVKRAVSLEAVLSRYDLLAGMAKKGQNLAGPCPFCKGKSARLFQVNLAKGAWYCFGCKQGGNVLDFVARKEGVSVRSAAVRLDTWFELGLREEAPRASPPVAAAETPPPPVAEELPLPPSENPPLTFTLKTLDPHHASLEVLGLGPSTIERFGAGYCAKGHLKGRLAIPIHNSRGELVAYVGLALHDDQAPRYLFPPKFHASLEVMNLHRLALAEESGPLYLAPDIEGALRLSEAGVTSVIGLFDGTLSRAQEEAIESVLSPYERLVLVGDDFPERTVARLARYIPLSWVWDLGTVPDLSELAEPHLLEAL